MTMTGPHRDDFDVILNGKSLKKYGSQGQTRTGVLKIKLAECEIIKDITGEEPILLLDDVLSELDEQRRKYFINNIEGRQVIITCTDRNFAEDENASYFYVKEGKVEECK
jgi:DNA replication and repair protein RecF